MTSKIRRTEINIETREIKIIRFSRRHFSVYCERCQTIVAAFPLEQIAAILRMNLTDVCRSVGADEFHLISAKRDLPLVCEKSFGTQARRLEVSAD